MSVLCIGGVDGDNFFDLPLAFGSVRTGLVEIGERGFAFDGSPFSSIRAVKRTIKAKTTPLTASEVEFWRSLINGSGFSALWNGADYSYTDQGHVKSDAAGASTAVAGGYDGSNCLALTGGVTKKVTYPVGLVSTPWTFMVHRKIGAGGWTFHVQTSAGSRYENWVAIAGGTYTWFTYDATGFTLKGDAGGVAYYDDLIFLPAIVPANVILNWPSAPAVTPRPTVLLYGDLIAQWGSQGATMLGRVADEELVSYLTLAGTYQMGTVLDIEFREV